jgi:hypothetical protein
MSVSENHSDVPRPFGTTYATCNVMANMVRTHSSAVLRLVLGSYKVSHTARFMQCPARVRTSLFQANNEQAVQE